MSVRNIQVISRWGPTTIIKFMDDEGKFCYYVHDYLVHDQLYGLLIVTQYQIDIRKFLKKYESTNTRALGIRLNPDTRWFEINEAEIEEAFKLSSEWNSNSSLSYPVHITQTRILRVSKESPTNFIYMPWDDMYPFQLNDVDLWCDMNGRGIRNLKKYSNKSGQNTREVIGYLMEKDYLQKKGKYAYLNAKCPVLIQLDDYNRIMECEDTMQDHVH